MIVGVLILLMVVNVHSLWIYELLPSRQCGVDHDRRDFEAVVWPWISAIVNVYLPLVIVAATVRRQLQTKYHTASPVVT